MPQQKVVAEQQGFTASALIELWVVDGSAIGLNTIFRFCNGDSSNYRAVVFNGIQYVPFPIKVEAMEQDGKGTLPRPKLTVSNINGFVSNLLLQNQQLVGATVTRTRVFARFLDAVNFDSPPPRWVTPDPTASYPPEPFYVNRKVTENMQIVQFELASALEVQGTKLPRRQIFSNTCVWPYRQPNTCNYSGVPVADIANRTFAGSFYAMTLVDQGTYNAATTYNRGDYVALYSTLPLQASVPTVWVCATNGTVGVTPSTNSSRWIADACPKTCAGCKLRHPIVLRTSAMPGTAHSPILTSR